MAAFAGAAPLTPISSSSFSGVSVSQNGIWTCMAWAWRASFSARTLSPSAKALRPSWRSFRTDSTSELGLAEVASPTAEMAGVVPGAWAQAGAWNVEAGLSARPIATLFQNRFVAQTPWPSPPYHPPNGRVRIRLSSVCAIHPSAIRASAVIPQS